jgi:HEAT repeat protein
MIRAGLKQKHYISISKASEEGLAKMGDPYANEVLAKYKLETETHVNLKADSELLKEIGAVDYIIECLNSENDRTRGRAAGFLIFLKDERAFDQLIAALSDGNSIVRMNAMSALASLGDKRAIEPIKLACDDAEKEVQKHAKYSLKILDAR